MLFTVVECKPGQTAKRRGVYEAKTALDAVKLAYPGVNISRYNRTYIVRYTDRNSQIQLLHAWTRKPTALDLAEYRNPVGVQ